MNPFHGITRVLNPVGDAAALAWFYSALDTWLDKAIDDRSNPCIFLRVDPEFDSLHKDPGFVTLLKRLG
jgi:hypothetical protein